MLEQLKTHSAAIEAQRQVLAGLQADHQRVTADTATGDDSAAQIVALKARRQDEVGVAYLEHREANTADIDKEVKSLEKRGAEFMARADAARAALPILAAQIQAAQAELQRLQVAQVEQALGLSRTAFETALAEYETICNTLLLRLVDVGAAAGVVNTLARRLTGTDGGAGAQGIAHYLADALRLPQRDARGAWTVTFGESTAARTGKVYAEACDRLAAAGLGLNGPALSPPRKESNAPTEARPVTVTTVAGDGQAAVQILSETR